MTPDEVLNHLRQVNKLTDSDLRGIISVAKMLLLERQQRRATEKYLKQHAKSAESR